MPDVKLGEITDDRLAGLLDAALEYGKSTISYKLTMKKGKAVLEVYADVPDEDMWLVAIGKGV